MSNFPCESDLRLFEAKRVPAWALAMRAGKKSAVTRHPDARELIDFCVNSHAGIRPAAGEMAAGNLLAIVSSWRRRGKDLAQELEVVSRHPECVQNPEKRAAFARKWAKRLAR